MKTVILAGGIGSRISEESHLKPKPMIELDNNMPILWHIMKYYSHFGHNDFIICCGYKGFIIKEYFANYYLHRSDVTFDFTKKNDLIIHNNVAEPWKVTLVDTGINTMTGGRVKRIRKYVEGETFMLTYGDGVADVDLRALIAYHKKEKKTATLTAIQPGGRFGTIEVNNRTGKTIFSEKRKEDGGWINGGFMVLDPGIFKYLKDDNTIFERQVLERLGKEDELTVYKHNGFWQCMDTMRDKSYLDGLVEKGEAPWMVWKK
ncbi:MAG: glucose-1-phosphate cytidylyltransferase [Deltaproteobacteria bacterium]|nr:glucose-1-phosphate cytidylyltransferase [Deltaproteobacteria bacterium]